MRLLRDVLWSPPISRTSSPWTPGTGRQAAHAGEAVLQQANFDQVGPSLVDAGLVTAADLRTAQRLLRDPAFIANHPLMITAWGRKPS